MRLTPAGMKYRRITKRVMKRIPYYAAMSDTQLQAQTVALRDRLANGMPLRSLLVDAYALVAEADHRVLGMTPFEVQVLGAVAMEYNNIIEMKTGEGKTLTATMPMYLHGLTGPGNFLITANGYLANRDAEQMGKVYRWLGLSVAAGVAESGDNDDNRDKKAIYAADIVYTTNSGLGFDYLFDNLAATKAEQYLHGFHFAILDEADAILLDDAETPLIVSGVPRVQSNLYGTSDKMIKLLEEDVDYEQSEDKKNVWFTEDGIAHMETFLGVKGLLTPQWADLYRHLLLALRANVLMTAGRSYLVDDGEVKLLDRANGRELPGMKMQAGMHQAVEAKEHVALSQEQRSMASVTYQNLFRMFDQIAGMTGTAKTDADEFLEIYHLAVFAVPTNKPNVRRDERDRMYITNQAKLQASLKMVHEAHDAGRPILIETGSLSLSNLYSRLLLREHLAHNLLNARSSAKEARIVAEAGQPGAITVATSMAGRGTDIRLGEGVAEKGGLLVLGTERMDNPRVDNQLRGRAGRQGDPGESIFYTSLEDTIVQEQAPQRIARYRVKHADRQQQRLSAHGRFRHVIDRAQRKLQASQRNARFETLQYGEVFRIQRDSVYEARDQIMAQDDLTNLINIIFKKATTNFLDAHPHETTGQVLDYVFRYIDADFDTDPMAIRRTRHNVASVLPQLMRDRLANQHAQFKAEDQWHYFLRLALLKAIDNAWIEQVDNLQSLRTITANRNLASHNPIYEYQAEAQRSFGQMKEVLYDKCVENLLQSNFTFMKDGKMHVDFP
ncbi:accessory Sec system translocase SecA2 [Lacticaseibacillus pabuli]|uniref:Protein translocase subunit SecA n=1 Tax=Lacticaseibacillus pabuli TaxID=3025672 RepID=A0ABY7WSG6_9LACO|nr:accessory Sec system translocase SecA2 [Lacticaseibacillus sp. KACC 23028]WDF83071.1 accessory Sec system translocase SecA2 [Lacticaseibacillus sp. KACC 23028]